MNCRSVLNPLLMLSLGRYVMFDVVFSRGSELTQLNFCGFYIVVLERDGEVVSVVTIRIFGKRVVEIPFVATKKQCRRQGMCDILMNEIEKLLTYLGVKEIVLPPSRDVIHTWTNSFGFVRMAPSHKFQYIENVFLHFDASCATKH